MLRGIRTFALNVMYKNTRHFLPQESMASFHQGKMKDCANLVNLACQMASFYKSTNEAFFLAKSAMIRAAQHLFEGQIDQAKREVDVSTEVSLRPVYTGDFCCDFELLV